MNVVIINQLLNILLASSYKELGFEIYTLMYPYVNLKNHC